jgi:hypothetical protein
MALLKREFNLIEGKFESAFLQKNERFYVGRAF